MKPVCAWNAALGGRQPSVENNRSRPSTLPAISGEPSRENAAATTGRPSTDSRARRRRALMSKMSMVPRSSGMATVRPSGATAGVPPGGPSRRIGAPSAPPVRPSHTRSVPSSPVVTSRRPPAVLAGVKTTSRCPRIRAWTRPWAGQPAPGTRPAPRRRCGRRPRTRARSPPGASGDRNRAPCERRVSIRLTPPRWVVTSVRPSVLIAVAGKNPPGTRRRCRRRTGARAGGRRPDPR